LHETPSDHSSRFVQAYQQRQIADYDTVKPWSRTEALAIIDAVDDAFKAWRKIRNHRFTQDYLFSFFGEPKGR
jgi:hypothetical protein